MVYRSYNNNIESLSKHAALGSPVTPLSL